MYTDPIADLLTRIRNAQHGRRTHVTMPHSKLKVELLKVLKSNGFILGYNENKGENNKNTIEVELDLTRNPISLKRISKPGQRIYKKGSEMKRVKSGLGINVISTSQGVMTGAEAKDKNIGGEVLCEIY